jgi:hypothetical protein
MINDTVISEARKAANGELTRYTESGYASFVVELAEENKRLTAENGVDGKKYRELREAYDEVVSQRNKFNRIAEALFGMFNVEWWGFESDIDDVRKVKEQLEGENKRLREALEKIEILRRSGALKQVQIGPIARAALAIREGEE